jgi:hypothetical protein
MISCINLISFLLYDVFPVVIHNQCSDFKLTSPAYFGRNAIWIRFSDQKVDTNAMTRASFGRSIFKIEFEGALIYKLQRKKCIESSLDSTFTEDKPTNLQLLIIWESNNRDDVFVRALLIKHSNAITWDEDKLERLYSMYRTQHTYGYFIEDTWLLDDATVLMTTSIWEEKRHTTEVTISEGIRERNSMEPLSVPSDI